MSGDCKEQSTPVLHCTALHCSVHQGKQKYLSNHFLEIAFGDTNNGQLRGAEEYGHILPFPRSPEVYISILNGFVGPSPIKALVH